MIWFLFPVFLIPSDDLGPVIVEFNIRGGRIVDVHVPGQKP